METRVDTAKTPLGKLAYHLFFHQTPEGAAENFFYMVSYCDYPEGTVSADSTELVDLLLRESVDEAAFSVNGKVIYADKINYFQYPGMIWRVDYRKSTLTIKTRAYFIGRRYYTVQTVMARALALNPASDRFLDSFQLLE